MTKLKWCIKRTEQNYKEVNDYFRNKWNSISGNYWYLHFDLADIVYLAIDKHPDFHEITLDEFRLLTDPERYYEYAIDVVVGANQQLLTYRTYSRGHQQGEGLVPHYPVVSEPVFNELQRMWKERESEAIEKIEDDWREMGSETEIEFIAMWQSQMELNLQAMNKVTKALDKQNKLLRKLIKKQNPKRHEKTIM